MNKNIIPSFACAITGLTLGAIQIIRYPFWGLVGGVLTILLGIILAWLFKPKAERIITADEANKVKPW